MIRFLKSISIIIVHGRSWLWWSLVSVNINIKKKNNAIEVGVRRYNIKKYYYSIGILLTIYVWFIFRIYGETPVIKASGRELSSLLLLSILASFLMTFAIVAEPITETCAITRFGIGFCYTLCYAALVTKTNRIHRIFNNISHSPRKSRYTSPKSQLLITGILILLEVIVNVILLIRVPPRVKHIYPTRDTKIKICQGLDDRSYIVSLIYPFVLIGKSSTFLEEKKKMLSILYQLSTKQFTKESFFSIISTYSYMHHICDQDTKMSGRF